MKRRAEVAELKDGFTQVVIRQEAPGDEGLLERTLVLRNYHDGYVDLCDGDDRILVSPMNVDEVCLWLKRLTKMTPKEPEEKR